MPSAAWLTSRTAKSLRKSRRGQRALRSAITCTGSSSPGAPRSRRPADVLEQVVGASATPPAVARRDAARPAARRTREDLRAGRGSSRRCGARRDRSPIDQAQPYVRPRDRARARSTGFDALAASGRGRADGRSRIVDPCPRRCPRDGARGVDRRRRRYRRSAALGAVLRHLEDLSDARDAAASRCPACSERAAAGRSRSDRASGRRDDECAATCVPADRSSPQQRLEQAVIAPIARSASHLPPPRGCASPLDPDRCAAARW